MCASTSLRFQLTHVPIMFFLPLLLQAPLYSIGVGCVRSLDRDREHPPTA
jgi:hypothetical protein